MLRLLGIIFLIITAPIWIIAGVVAAIFLFVLFCKLIGALLIFLFLLALH